MQMHEEGLARIDPDQYTPVRLAGDVDYSVLEELSEFEHRGERCRVGELIIYLVGCVDAAARKQDEHPEPGTLSEFEAVDAVLEGLQHRFPTWSGVDDAVLDALGTPVSEQHIQAKQLEDQFWAGEVAPDTEDVSGADIEAIRRVVVPMVGLFLEVVQAQRAADRVAAREVGRRDIKRAVIRRTVDLELSEADVEEAVEDAKAVLSERQSEFGDR